MAKLKNIYGLRIKNTNIFYGVDVLTNINGSAIIGSTYILNKDQKQIWVSDSILKLSIVVFNDVGWYSSKLEHPCYPSDFGKNNSHSFFNINDSKEFINSVEIVNLINNRVISFFKFPLWKDVVMFLEGKLDRRFKSFLIEELKKEYPEKELKYMVERSEIIMHCIGDDEICIDELYLRKYYEKSNIEVD